MRGEISHTTKSFLIELRLANQIDRINFVRLNISHFDNVQIYRVSLFLFPKTIRCEKRHSRNFLGFVLIYEQYCYKLNAEIIILCLSSVWVGSFKRNSKYLNVENVIIFSNRTFLYGH